MVSTEKCEYVSLGRKDLYEVTTLAQWCMQPFLIRCQCALQVLQHYPSIMGKIYRNVLLIVESELEQPEEPDIIRNGQVLELDTETFAWLCH